MNDRLLAKKLGISVVLLVLVFTIYGSTGSHSFIEFDDNRYVYENGIVRQGLSREGIAWAFSTFWAANWHPITWLSHMADVQMFGLDAGWHHWTNVLLHGLNAVFLFLVLHSMTNAVWRSALVAALFAAHPQHVESVAWVAERKDVLSTCFWLLTMAAYVNFVRHGGVWRQVVLVATYSLGLMSKPMLVTLPLALLLLDYWPLGRLASGTVVGSSPRFGACILGLIREKALLFALALTSSVITYIAQSSWQATVPLGVIPLGQRISNALVAAVSYLAKTVYPVSLAVFYPHPATIGESVSVVEAAAAAGILGALSGLSLLQWQARPWIPVGWLWFLITLAPVIGVVQVGAQAMADRYVYVPHIGLFILGAWSIPGLVERSRYAKAVFVCFCGGILLALSATARAQVNHWRDDVTLYSHAIAVTTSNWLAWNNLGTKHYNAESFERALACFRQATRFKPDFFDAWYNAGTALQRLGRPREAIESYETSLRLEPRNANAWFNLGLALQTSGNYAAAIESYKRVLALRPDDSETLYHLALAHAEYGNLAGASEAAQRLRGIDSQKWADLMGRGVIATNPRSESPAGQ